LQSQTAENGCRTFRNRNYLEVAFQQLAYAGQNAPEQLAVGSEYLLELLPDRWTATHSELVRKDHRIDENRRVSEKKRPRRARRGIIARRKAHAMA